MFNPVKASKNIKDEFVSYVKTSFNFADKDLRNQFEEQLKGIISQGPYLELNSVFKSGKNMADLIDDGILSPLFRELEKGKGSKKHLLPLERSLYLHQEKAIRSIIQGNNVVISTGTGSGKTNCFLIPVINKLLLEKEAGALGPGIRALFIYPMNALANDQLKNIRRLLMDYEDITFGVYNGGTEYEEDEAIKLYEAMFANESEEKLRKPLRNELLSRDKMKETPPNILFTNYAMLEHLLFRPNDDVLFSKADFRFVVLDEAHVYSGATGIETAILLRRLRARISTKGNTQFILTSATLGNGKDADDDIVTFAENLCGVPFSKENIIRSTRDRFIAPSSPTSLSFELIRELSDESKSIPDLLNKHGISLESKPEAEVIYDLVSSSAQYCLLRNFFKDRTVATLSDLVPALKARNIEDVIAFISLCSMAVKNGKQLIDARYHFFVRSLEGAFITLGKQRKLSLIRKQCEDNDRYFEAAICTDCGHFALVGKITDGKLQNVGKFDEKIEYFYPIMKHGLDELEQEDSEDEEDGKTEAYILCPHCGAIVEEGRRDNRPCDCNPEDYVHLRKTRRTGSLGQTSLPKCGNCIVGHYERVYLGNDAATSVLATSLYEELPEITYRSITTNVKTTNNVFAMAIAANRKESIRSGKQFLVFSDSRQEAAKFAVYLGKSYEEFLRRRGICRLVSKIEKETEPESISDYVTNLTSYFSSKRSFSSSNNDRCNLTVPSKKNAWVAMLNELARFSSSTSLTGLGILQFRYRGVTDEMIQALAKEYNKPADAIKNLLGLLTFEIVRAGAIVPNEPEDIDDNDREYIFYTPSQKFVTLYSEQKYSTTINWQPQARKNGKGYYPSNRLYYVKRVLGLDNEKAIEFLKQYFEYMTLPDYGNPCSMERPNHDGFFVLPARYFDVLLPGNKDARWFRCKKCGKVSQFEINGHCASVKCNGEVTEIDPGELHKDNHFANLYMSDRMSPLFIKEHTAQLSRQESLEYQEEFVKKEINALSCSTTFEMGVDVGDLETVFLRDVPPLPSNYAQRAGRAGRSIDAAAYCLTFAKLSSHDLSYFKDPTKMINGVILPPLFKIDNEKIVRRHVYDVALSMFFSDNPNQYNHNDAEMFINEKGYHKFIDWLNTKPERLKKLLLKSIPNVNDLHKRLGIDDFSWLEGFIGTDGTLTVLLREYEGNVQQFESIIKRQKRNNELENAASTEKKLKNYTHNQLINFLARGNVLPRYGFPVDTVELEQNATAPNIDKLRLSRDMSVAIAEYAPSSEVVADGKLYTSRYIKKSDIGNNNKEWHTAFLGVCPNEECQATNYSVTPIGKEGLKCASCGQEMHKEDFYESIEPRAGFVTERDPKEVPLSRQAKNYKSEDIYIGNTEAKRIDKFRFRFNGIDVEIESTTNDSLMVKSFNEFYVCPKCGYALAEDETIAKDPEANKLISQHAHKITTKAAHESLFGQYKCDCKELVKYSLHHVFNTDVAKINFSCDTSDYKTMVSTMYAILYAITGSMNIERKDIKACLTWKIVNHTKNYSIIIYDAVAGGAGHSRRLVTGNGQTLYRILMIALQNMRSCSCDPSCYNCLRSYENQRLHDDLDRHLAEKFLSQFVGKIELAS